MPRHRLTDRYIRNLEPPPRTHMVWDTLQSGFGIQVTPHGTKSFKVVYHHGGRLRWYHIDRYPAIYLKDARKVAKQIRAKVTLGEDPQGEKINDRKADKLARETAANGETLQQVAEQYVKRHARRKNKSWRQAKKLLERYVFPSLGNHKFTEIVRKDVTRIFDHLTEDKKNPVLANQVLTAISAVFTWAVKQEIVVGDNPAHNIDRNKPKKKKKRFLSKAEVKSVWSKFEDLGFYQRLALRFILVTAQRPGEVLRLRWQDVDLEEKIWTLSGEPTGDWPGTKNAYDHEVPLSPQAIALLEEIGLKAKGPVFPPRMAIPKTKAIWTGLGITRFRPHDLRATAATGMDMLGIHKEHIARVLNHAEGGVTAGYIRHDFMDQKRQALETWGAHLAAVVEGQEPPSVVVDFQSARTREA